MQSKFFGSIASWSIPIALVACGYRPPYPPPLHTTDYLEYRESRLPASDAGVELRIAGARLAKGGLYLDVLVHSGGGDEQGLRSLARSLGRSLSIHDPSEELLIEMTDSDGREVGLRAMKRPQYFNPGVICVLYASPPTHGLDEHRFIQTCMFRTDRQLKPGAYRARFLEGWDTWFGGLFRPADREWHELRLDWPPLPPDS